VAQVVMERAKGLENFGFDPGGKESSRVEMCERWRGARRMRGDAELLVVV